MRAKQDDCLDNIRSETEKQELTCQKNQESKTRKMKLELEQVKSKYDSALEMHFSEEAQLRKVFFPILFFICARIVAFFFILINFEQFQICSFIFS